MPKIGSRIKLIVISVKIQRNYEDQPKFNILLKILNLNLNLITNAELLFPSIKRHFSQLYLHGVLQSEDTPHHLGLFSDIKVFLRHLKPYTIVTSSHNRWEDCPEGKQTQKFIDELQTLFELFVRALIRAAPGNQCCNVFEHCSKILCPPLSRFEQ